MTRFLTAMLCITLFLAGCKKETIGPNYFGSRTANLAGMKSAVEKKLGGRPGNFEHVVLMNGSYYFKSEEAILNDRTVGFITTTEWEWNQTWNAFMIEAHASLQDAQYGKRYWQIGTVPYGFDGEWGKGLMLVQVNKDGSVSYLAVIY